MGTGTTGAAADPRVQVPSGQGSSMGRENPWDLRVSWLLRAQMTALRKTVEAGGQAPVPGKKTSSGNPTSRAQAADSQE